MINVVYGVYFFHHLLRKRQFGLFMTIEYTSTDLKSRQFVNYGKNIRKKH